MWTDPAWMQRGVDALREMLDVDAHLKRDMIQFLFDEGLWDTEKLSWEGAMARFNACLNPAKPEFFKVSELWALMKRFNRHQLFLAMADDLGYTVQRKATPERMLELIERYVVAAERHGVDKDAARAEIERLASLVDQPTRVGPAVRAGGKFSLLALGF